MTNLPLAYFVYGDGFAGGLIDLLAFIAVIVVLVWIIRTFAR